MVDWMEDTAKNVIYETPTKTFFRKKKRIQTTQPDPAWEATYKAYKESTDYKKFWISKWVTSRIPTNGKLKEWKIVESDACPRYGEPETKRKHILHCQQAPWPQEMDKLNQWLDTNYTDPNLQMMIIEGLNSWRNNTNPHLTEIP